MIVWCGAGGGRGKIASCVLQQLSCLLVSRHVVAHACLRIVCCSSFWLDPRMVAPVGRGAALASLLAPAPGASYCEGVDPGTSTFHCGLAFPASRQIGKPGYVAGLHAWSVLCRPLLVNLAGSRAPEAALHCHIAHAQTCCMLYVGGCRNCQFLRSALGAQMFCQRVSQ